MRFSEELAEIFVTASSFNEDRKNGSVFHRQFRADDGPNAMLAGGDGKSLGAVNAVAIEQRHRRHLQFGRGLS
jgi:hypothetical protein